MENVSYIIMPLITLSMAACHIHNVLSYLSSDRTNTVELFEYNELQANLYKFQFIIISRPVDTQVLSVANWKRHYKERH